MSLLLLSSFVFAYQVEVTSSGAEQHWEVSEVPYYINIEDAKDLKVEIR